MVPSNMLQRIFHIGHNGSIGTGFTIDVDGRQYLVTARHVVEGLTSDSQISLLRNGAWGSIDIGNVWNSPTGADIALLSLRSQLSPAHHIVVGGAGSFFLSQQIFFLGFPFGLNMEVGQINNGYPMPFVKTGIVSSFSSVSGGSQLIYCDGHNNPGFSGGPIVTVSARSEVTIIAVVSAYRYNEDPVLLNGVDSGLTYRSNTGLVIGCGVNEALLHARAAADGVAIAGA